MPRSIDIGKLFLEPPTCPLRILTTSTLTKVSPLPITSILRIESRTTSPPGSPRKKTPHPQYPVSDAVTRYPKVLQLAHIVYQPTTSPTRTSKPPHSSHRPTWATAAASSPRTHPHSTSNNLPQNDGPHDNRDQQVPHQPHTAIRAPRTTSKRPVLQKRPREMRKGNRNVCSVRPGPYIYHDICVSAAETGDE